ncbi:MAG: hypothetical protein Q8K19_13320 [Methylicorpusculum sp.]|uniref:hypothetical protein n=1 Tax=Methylicorpusculum sp. TaxID=2713644 RepID=UPI002730C0FA|nr:hypothetical protein [Methylicorpusculum sp.]MDP2179474.1 hypothetical protein [Methylicorpusculum sp.]
MSSPTLSTADEYIISTPIEASAVSWGAILAGAMAAASLALILLMLGTGLGLSSVSPWSFSGVSATTFGVSTILWLTFTQLAASGMGGYLAGRLRNKWVAVQTDEVYFRDTAHGFLAWAVAVLTTAALLTAVIGSIVSNGVQAGASVMGGAVSATAGAVGTDLGKANNGSESIGYFVDSLFRKDFIVNPGLSGAARVSVLQSGEFSAPASVAITTEVSRIFLNSIRQAALPVEDLQYVGQIVALRTGLSQQDAEKRVTNIYTRLQTQLRNAETATKEAAEQARKASAYAALWFFISLLSGAFVASYAAIFGGQQRDQY